MTENNPQKDSLSNSFDGTGRLSKAEYQKLTQMATSEKIGDMVKTELLNKETRQILDKEVSTYLKRDGVSEANKNWIYSLYSQILKKVGEPNIPTKEDLIKNEGEKMAENKTEGDTGDQIADNIPTKDEDTKLNPNVDDGEPIDGDDGNIIEKAMV